MRFDMDNREYDDFFERSFDKAFGNKEDHEFVRYNEAMGIMTYGKEHYKMELKKRRLLPYDAALEIAERKDENKPISYQNMPDSYKDIIRSLSLTADKNGNIKIEGRAYDALVGIGAIDTVERDLSNFNPNKGGIA